MIYPPVNIDPILSLECGHVQELDDVALAKQQSRVDDRKYCFSQRTITEWNKSSTDCVHANSVNTCSRTEYLVRIDGYTWAPCPLSSWTAISLILNAIARSDDL